MHRYALLCAFLAAGPFSSPASALDKVDPYICPTKTEGSGLDCFLEAVPQTYTMCRHIKSIEILEFGLAGAQEGVHGAKTEYCIDKHKLLMVRPYQAALRESAKKKEMVEGVRKLHDVWLESLAKLVPQPEETDEAYKQRVVRPYTAFNEQIQVIRTIAEAPLPSPAKPAKSAKRK